MGSEPQCYCGRVGFRGSASGSCIPAWARYRFPLTGELSIEVIQAVIYRLLAIFAQPQRCEQLPILVHARVGGGQELVAVKDRIRSSKKAERLCFLG
jgi:hypothetical protein